MSITASDVAWLLQHSRLPTSSEAALQEKMWERIMALPCDVEREVRLAPGERIDFLVRGDIGIEAKVKCPRRHIYRQLERYAGIDRIKSLILVTATALGLPATINGKPLYYVSLGRASL